MEGKYKDIINDLYLKSCEEREVSTTKLQFLGSDIFDFTTYDQNVDEQFAEKMIEVIECILNKSTFEYQDNESNYINYLIMVNMPFLVGKLDWGTSIRGAWFDEYGHHSEKEEEKVYHIGHNLSIPKKDIKIFLKELLEWSTSSTQDTQTTTDASHS